MRLVKAEGHEVTIETSGQEAIRTAEGFQPDVILLDINLPHITGHEVARRIRASDWGRKVVLIAVSAFGDEENRKKSQAAGCDLHVTKPILNVAEFLTTLPTRDGN